ncbi:MAG TPA: LysR substrate-binding domain-containing protein [Emticicia sp.]
MIAIDFKLSVFMAAARHLNFTKAAQDLNISQPAISKNIHELEVQTGHNLFERNGNRLMLTETGQMLLSYAQQIQHIYDQLNENLDILDGRAAGELRLGASTTISHYIIPEILADFHTQYPLIKIKTLHGNSKQVEEWLQQKEIDLGIVEGLTDNASMKYEEFLKDELVLVTRHGNPLVPDSGSVNPALLKEVDFVLREQGSGTNEVIRKALMKIGIGMHELHVKVVLASTESIKNFLHTTNCFSFLSIHAITKELKNEELQIVELNDFEIERSFFFVHPQGVIGRLPENFRRFAMKKYNL